VQRSGPRKSLRWTSGRPYPIVVTIGGDATVSLILIIVVLVLLFGGGGFYGHRQGYYGGRGLGGILGILVVILILLFVFGGLGGPGTVPR
jgi:hypothetical protein